MKDLIHSSFLDVLEQSEDNKKILNSLIKQYKHKIEKEILQGLILSYVKKANLIFNRRFKNLKEHLFYLDGCNIYFNYKNIFHFDTSNDLGEQYAEFRKVQNDLINNAQETIIIWKKQFNDYESMINREVIPELLKKIEKNYLYHTHKNQTSFHSSFTLYGHNKIMFKTDMFINGSSHTIIEVKDVESHEVEKLKNMAYKSFMNLYETERINYNLTIKHKLNKMDFSDYRFGWSNSDTDYECRNGEVIINANILKYSDNELHEIVTNLKNYKSLYKNLQSIYRRLPNEIRFVTKVSGDNIFYNLLESQVSLSMNVDSEEYQKFIKEIDNIKADVIAFEKSKKLNLIKENNCLLRYFIIKTDEYEENGSKFIVYRYRGSQNKTKYKTFKDGKALSNSQQCKAYRKRKLNK